MEKKENTKKNERPSWREVVSREYGAPVYQMPQYRSNGVRLSPSLQAMLDKTECSLEPAA